MARRTRENLCSPQKGWGHQNSWKQHKALTCFSLEAEPNIPHTQVGLLL